MVDQSAALDTVFRALADPTRRAMLAALADGARTVGELGAPFEMSFAGASKHVKVLEQAGLLARERRGRAHLCRLRPAPLAEAHDWLDRYAAFWSDRLDALEEALKDDDSKTTQKGDEDA